MRKPVDLLEPAEAALELGIAPRTLARYRLEGRIPYVKYSARKYLYRKHDIDWFKESAYHEPCPYEL